MAIPSKPGGFIKELFANLNAILTEIGPPVQALFAQPANTVNAVAGTALW